MPRRRRRSVSPDPLPLDDDDDFLNSDDLSPNSGRCPPQQRNAANARERARMRVLSKAFCRLKTTLPWVPADTKLSKLDTLRLASGYIAHLRALLADQPTEELPRGGRPLNLSWPFTFQHGQWTSSAMSTTERVSPNSHPHSQHHHRHHHHHQQQQQQTPSSDHQTATSPGSIVEIYHNNNNNNNNCNQTNSICNIGNANNNDDYYEGAPEQPPASFHHHHDNSHGNFYDRTLQGYHQDSAL